MEFLPPHRDMLCNWMVQKKTKKFTTIILDGPKYRSKITVQNPSFGRSKVTVNNHNFGHSKITVHNLNFGRSKITIHNWYFGLSKIMFHNRTFRRFEITVNNCNFEQANWRLFQIYGYISSIWMITQKKKMKIVGPTLRSTTIILDGA